MNIKTTKKVVSLFLALLMIVSIVPSGVLKLEAAAVSGDRQSVINHMHDMATVTWTAGSTFNTLKGGTFTKGRQYYGVPYSQNSSIATISLSGFKSILSKNGNKVSADIGRNDCSYAVYQAWKQVDSGVENLNTAGLTPGKNNIVAVGDYTYTGNKKGTCTYNGKSVMYASYSQLQPGDAVLKDGHIMLVVSVNSSAEKITVIHQSGGNKNYNPGTDKTIDITTSSSKVRNTSWGVNEERTFSFLYSEGYIPVTCKKLASESYEIKTPTAGNITNSGAEITVRLNRSASVKKWTYFLSTNKSEVANINGASGSTHSSTSTVDCVRILDYQANPVTESSDKFMITKYQGNPLRANTTYYYKATVYIGGTWYQSSTESFTTANTKPGKATVDVSKDSKTVGIGDQVTVLWNGASNADTYSLTVKNTQGNTVQTKANISGLTYVLDPVAAAGVYTVQLTANNTAGSTVCSEATFEVKNNVVVTFYDTISKQVIARNEIPYGHDAYPPKNPVQEGHTFNKWSGSLEKITEDTQLDTIYDVNSYNVKFCDSFTEKVLKTQVVKYGEGASAPDVSAPAGYKLVSWDKDFSKIRNDMTVYTVYKWADKEFTATAEVNSVKRNTTKQGYDISVKITNRVDSILSGRVVVVLKSEKGVMLTSAESAAFAVDSLESKNVSLTVLYPELAYQVQVYVVDAFNTLSYNISENVTKDIDNSTASQWSEWITYTGNCPMTTGDGLVVEKRTLTDVKPEKSYYRYKVKETTTSTATSMSGFTQDGYNLVKASSGTIDYAPEWHSGFDTSHSLYSKYHVSPKSASESATQKVVINSNDTIGYIYWHWCRGESVGAINRSIAWNKTSTFKKFHAFYQAGSAVSYNSGANAYKITNKSVCNDTYWWNGRTSGTHALIYVKRQNYTIYNKVYNYYKLSDFTDWTEYSGSVPVSNGASAGTNKTYQNVETKTEPGETVYTYQYRYMTTSNPVINEPSVDSKRVVNLSFDFNQSLAGKRANVWVYKYAQASDYTLEFVDSCTVGSAGTINIKSAVMREAISQSVGDYSVVVSVAGETKFISLGKIEVEKPEYTVTFYDFDGKKVISSQKVREGDNAVMPSSALLNVPDGCEFTNWNESVVNVRGDLRVFPECQTKKYIAAFVNWDKQTVSLKEFSHGSTIIADAAPDTNEGFVTSWVINDNGRYVTLDAYSSAGKVITGNTVIETRTVLEKYNVVFLDVDESGEISQDTIENLDMDIMDIADSQTVNNGDYIDFSNVQEEIEENPDYVFYGWKNAATGEYLKETAISSDMIIYPSYSFAESVSTPYASAVSGEYTSSQKVELKCEDEGAVIWYTTDGSDPKISDTAREYVSPVTVSTSSVLMFYAGAVAKNDSPVVTEAYAINTSSVKYHVVKVITDNFEGEDKMEAAVLVREGRKLPASLFESLPGYRFDSIYYDYEMTDEFYSDSETITESFVLYAHFVPETYEVIFKDWNGSLISKQVVVHQKTALNPEKPDRDGYAFVGWDNDFSCITADIVINAKYIPAEEYASVSITRTRPLSIRRGCSFQLYANITTESAISYEIEWISSNSNIVKVDQNGLVTAVGKGEAVVSARIPYTGSVSNLTITVTESPDYTITLSNSSKMSFDSSRNLRGVSLTENTVEKLKEQFENDNLSFYDPEGNELTDSDRVGTGYSIKLYEEDELYDSVTVILTGDANADGRVNNKDVSYTTRFIVNKEDPDSIYQIMALDVNGDGKVNNRDATMLSRYLVGKENLI